MHRYVRFLIKLTAVLTTVGCSDPKPAAVETIPGPPFTTREEEHEPAPSLLVTEALPVPPAGVNFLSGIAACSRSVGRLDLFVVSTTGEIWDLALDGTWKAWQAVSEPGTADSALSASTHGQTIDLFYRDSKSHRLGHRYLEPGADREWQSELVGSSTILPFAPAAASWAKGRIDVFI